MTESSTEEKIKSKEHSVEKPERIFISCTKWKDFGFAFKKKTKSCFRVLETELLEIEYSQGTRKEKIKIKIKRVPEYKYSFAVKERCWCVPLDNGQTKRFN